jgi:hypothetical protein
VPSRADSCDTADTSALVALLTDDVFMSMTRFLANTRKGISWRASARACSAPPGGSGLRADDRAAADGDEAIGADRDDDPYVRV